MDTTTIDRTTLDTFTRQYIETALWSSTAYDPSEEDGEGEPMDDNHDIGDIAEETLRVMIADCRDFQASFGDYIADDPSRAGHDFWLTRNGHGAGFWDGDWSDRYRQLGDEDTHPTSDQYDTVGDFLAAMSKPYGSFDLYIGDDGLIHGQ